MKKLKYLKNWNDIKESYTKSLRKAVLKVENGGNGHCSAVPTPIGHCTGYIEEEEEESSVD